MSSSLIKSSGIEALLAELRALTSHPLEGARSMPPAAYLDPAFADLEREKIFRSGWICLGRADEMPEPGDFLTHQIDGQPIVAMRQDDGTIKTLANVCLHRAAVLMKGSGNARRMVCPYHTWAYDRDGRLLRTPLVTLQNEPGCKAGDLRLRAFATELWGGFLFVNLDENAQPLGPQLVDLDAALPGMALANYRNISVRDETWAANWKLLVENFNESYHTFSVHRTSLQPMSPSQTVRMVDGGEAYGLHFSPLIPDAGTELAHPDKPGIAEDQRAFLAVFTVYPSFMVAGTHNTLWWMSLQPDGPDKVAVRWGTSLTPEVLADPAYAGAGATFEIFVDIANAEDKRSLEAVMLGIAAPFTAPGRLTALDQVVWEFGRFIDRALNGAPSPTSP